LQHQYDAVQVCILALATIRESTILFSAEVVGFEDAMKQSIYDTELHSFMRRMLREQLVNQFDQRPELVRAWFEQQRDHPS
jgi:hypothetical protein